MARVGNMLYDPNAIMKVACAKSLFSLTAQRNKNKLAMPDINSRGNCLVLDSLGETKGIMIDWGREYFGTMSL